MTNGSGLTMTYPQTLWRQLNLKIGLVTDTTRSVESRVVALREASKIAVEFQDWQNLTNALNYVGNIAETFAQEQVQETAPAPPREKRTLPLPRKGDPFPGIPAWTVSSSRPCRALCSECGTKLYIVRCKRPAVSVMVCPVCGRER